jgi:small subunit ribosomal protein S6
MPLYEHVFLTRQDASAQQVEELTAQFKGVIEQLGGKVPKAEQWGLKSLSYRLRKNRKAHFTLFNVDAPASALAEVERQERLNEDVLRYLTIRVEGHEEGPSAMMSGRSDFAIASVEAFANVSASVASIAVTASLARHARVQTNRPPQSMARSKRRP